MRSPHPRPRPSSYQRLMDTAIGRLKLAAIYAEDGAVETATSITAEALATFCKAGKAKVRLIARITRKNSGAARG